MILFQPLLQLLLLQLGELFLVLLPFLFVFSLDLDLLVPLPPCPCSRGTRLHFLVLLVLFVRALLLQAVADILVTLLHLVGQNVRLPGRNRCHVADHDCVLDPLLPVLEPFQCHLDVVNFAFLHRMRVLLVDVQERFDELQAYSVAEALGYFGVDSELLQLALKQVFCLAVDVAELGAGNEEAVQLGLDLEHGAVELLLDLFGVDEDGPGAKCVVLVDLGAENEDDEIGTERVLGGLPLDVEGVFSAALDDGASGDVEEELAEVEFLDNALFICGVLELLHDFLGYFGVGDLFALVDGGNDVAHELFHEATGEFGALVDEAEFLVIFLR